MSQLSLDSFIEAFSAQLVQNGHRVLPLNDARVRNSLKKVYQMFDRELVRARGATVTDRAWLASLSNIKNVFEPSPIGSFDEFEGLLRAKQTYLTDHPNPYYQAIVIRLPLAAARKITANLDERSSNLVEKAVKTYLGQELVG